MFLMGCSRTTMAPEGRRGTNACQPWHDVQVQYLGMQRPCST